ncbi:MAG: hypothetical protein IT431_11430 [Phycisphaerales bacterium]|nr:hypothetical protein [Phycisphaerales bacterium]
MNHDPELLQRRFDRERRARKEAESLLEERSRSLYQANASLQEAMNTLQSCQVQLVQSEKMASVGQLAAGVAHEINNPIGFISSNLNTLREYLTDLAAVMKEAKALSRSVLAGAIDLHDRAQAFGRACEQVDLEYILGDLEAVVAESIHGTDRVRKIVADLRDFSHIDTPNLTHTNLNELIDQTLTVAAHELKYKAEVVRQLGDMPDILCYGGKLSQVILNLLVNAAHAIGERGRITVRSGADDASVWFEIEDDGCGIPEENQRRIFDPFFTTKPVGTGTGLGLHLSARIVEAHAGRIAVRSKPGQGATFRVELPIAGPTADQEERTGARAA